MAIVPLFKNRRKYNTIIGKKGATYKFVNHTFFSIREDEIKELLEMAKTREAGIYIDPAEPEIDTERASPAEVMKKKIIAEYLKSQEAVRDMGASEQSTIQKSVATTASSVIMGNSLAESVAKEEVMKALEEPVAASMAPERSAALNALEKLKQDKK